MADLAPQPPRLPRVALQPKERDAALAEGRRVLELAARKTRSLTAYRGRTGVPEAIRLRTLERLRLDTQKTTRALTERLVRGELSRDAWQRQMRAALVPAHYAAALAGTGSDRLDERTRAAVEGRIREQLGYLSRFRVDVATQGHLDGRTLARSDLYGAAVWTTGQAARADQADREGHAEERGVLGARDHCESCLDRTAHGWVAIGTLLPIGAGICRSRCGCWIEYRGAPAAAAPPPRPTPVPRPVPRQAPRPAPAPIVPPAPPAPPKPAAYGPSRATVRHTDYTAADARRSARSIFGPGATVQDFASAVGAPDDATVEVVPDHETATVYVRGPGYVATRTIRRQVISEKVVVINDSFYVDPSHQGRGIGARVFGRQVEQASRLGVSELRTDAAGNAQSDLVGYRVWGRFGFNGQLPSAVTERIAAGTIPPPPVPAEQLSDLMGTPEGRAWWDVNGSTISVRFDLSEGSRSRQAWEGYRLERATREAAQ